MPGRVNKFLSDIHQLGGIGFGGKRPKSELGWRTDFEDSLLVEELLGSGAFGKVRHAGSEKGELCDQSLQLTSYHAPGACWAP